MYYKTRSSMMHCFYLPAFECKYKPADDAGQLYKCPILIAVFNEITDKKNDNLLRDSFSKIIIEAGSLA
jgi:hypothetical protein